MTNELKCESVYVQDLFYVIQPKRIPVELVLDRIIAPNRDPNRDTNYTINGTAVIRPRSDEKSTLCVAPRTLRFIDNRKLATKIENGDKRINQREFEYLQEYLETH